MLRLSRSQMPKFSDCFINSEKGDTAKTLAEKANKVLKLQLNFFGMGRNLNALIERIMGRQQH
jgi:hypothetical protein